MKVKLFFFFCAVLIGTGLCHASGTTNASVYLDNDENFIVSNSGATLYGSPGNDTVSIAADVSGVTLDQNVERINFSAASTTYTYRQTGNIINIYSFTGILLASVTVQMDGTMLSFSDGMASVVLSGAVMTLGGETVSPTTATSLSPALTPAPQLPAGYTSAKIYLGTDDSFTVSNSGATVYGGSGYDTVTISAGVTGVTLDQNVEHFILAGESSSYTFMQTGNIINVYDVTGVTLLVSATVQEDSDGTMISFSDGSASARLSGGVLSLGGVTVSSTAPTAIPLTVGSTAPTVTFTDPVNGAGGVALNKKISATFSEAMDPLTITTTNFTLTDGVTAVSGTVAYSGVTAVFTPDSNLAYNSTYTATITTAAKDLAGNPLASDYVWTFTTGTAPDTTAPTVTLTDPVNGAGSIAINKKISATFSEAMDPLAITNVNFTLTDNNVTPVSGTVTYAGLTAVFTPDSNLAYNTTYTATITTAAEDLAGNPLASDYVWTFTTGAAPDLDTTAPIVTLIDPANLKTGVALNKKISATFSEAMDPLTITNVTFTLTDGVTPVSGTVAYSGLTAVFTPDSDLAYNTTYTATITTAAKDLAGNPLANNYVWTFTTGAAPDTTAPIVTSTDPAELDTDVIISKKIQATFSEAMDPLTITNVHFTLTDGVTPVSGTVAYVGLVATFTPDSDLASNTTYTATITTAAKDLAGNPLASDYVWSFTTATVLPLGPAPVDLGTAGNFVLLTKSGITTTGVTHITGDIGVSPIDSTAITGFGLILDGTNQFSTSTLVTGKVYAADYAVPTPANLTTAISDMQTAYADAAGRTTPDFTELGAGNISGMNLVPGLYKWGTGVLIDPTGVTLTGGPDDVWIFQITDDLTLQNGAIVTLAGGAQPKNIFWQVGGGTGVSIGTTVQFQGIILATKAITMNTSSTLNGRALAQTNVTLDANTITEP